MFLLAAAAAAAGIPPKQAPSGPVVEAVATVRIVSGVRIKFDSPSNAGAPPAHDAKVTTDGTTHQARLIEFE